LRSLPDLNLAEATYRLRAGALTPRALVAAHLERIAARDPAIGAFARLAPDALAAADAGGGGPLRGLPIAVKDLVDTAGLATARGSHCFEGRVPGADAAVFARLRAAGAIVIGKTVTDELGLGGPATDTPDAAPRNPRFPGRVTGGSSSGSAAAVAGGLVRVALGTDSGGSVRVPAAFCGVVGLKPGRGRIATDGVFPLAPSLDHVALLAATVAEAAFVCDALAGTACVPALARGVAGLRLAFARDWFADDAAADPAVTAAIDAAVTALARQGARVAEVTLLDAAEFDACGAILLYGEAAALHRGLLVQPGLGRLARGTLEAALAVNPDALPQARVAAAALRETLDGRVFTRFDALLTATVLTPPPPATAFDGTVPLVPAARALAFNVTGHPALTVPPAGLQIVGPEPVICRIGAALAARGEAD